ncbi:MAG: hypothetical protein FWH18_00010 [Marinilabiliaceae bacterium]|nr:hypothetical protein [Marinilabiliaceae bacterium]
MNKKLMPFFELAKLSSNDTGFAQGISIVKKFGEPEVIVIFDPCDGEQNIRNFPYIRVHDLDVVGEYNKEKVDIDSIKKWTISNKEKIDNLFYNEIDNDIFRLYVMFSTKVDDLEYFIPIKPWRSGLSLSVWIDELDYYKYEKIQISVICKCSNDKFVGVVSAIDPKQFLFIKGYEKYSKEIVQWVRKYQQDIINVSKGKMQGLDFVGIVANDRVFESINETKPPDQVHVNSKLVYTFDINFNDDHPDNIMCLCDETYNTEVSRDIHFVSYKFKEYSEVSGNFFDEKEFNDVKSEFRKQLKDNRSKKNWIGEKFIKQALEKLKWIHKIDYEEYNDICVIIYPKTPSHDKLTDSIVYETLSSVYGANEIEDKKIMELRLINNKVQKEDSWYWPSEEGESNIWFNEQDLYREILYRKAKEYLKEYDGDELKLKIKEAKEWAEEQYEKDSEIVNRIISRFNNVGKFEIKEIAGTEEVKFRKYFHDYLRFENIEYFFDKDIVNILIIGKNIMTDDDITTSNSTLLEMIKRTEELLRIKGANPRDYRIICFRLLGN